MNTLLASTRAGSVILTLNRPERANSLNLEMIHELQNALEAAEKEGWGTEFVHLNKPEYWLWSHRRWKRAGISY